VVDRELFANPVPVHELVERDAVQIGQIKVTDGNPDTNTSENTLFLDQGIFVP
jgi:hypothetical protein